MFVDPYVTFNIEEAPGSSVTPYPSVCVMYHTSQECRFVLQVADAEAFQASYATPTYGIRAISTISVSLPLEFCVVTAGESKLADIGHDYKCTSEDAFIARLRAFDKFRAKNDVKRPGHRPRRDFRWILLDTNFLPVGELGSIYLKLPRRAISASGIWA
jgi:hypothetical protein